MAEKKKVIEYQFDNEITRSSFFAVIRFSKFRGAFVDDFEDDYGIKRCICIPIEDNNFQVSSRGNVFTTLFIMRDQCSSDKHTHSIFPYFGKDFQKFLIKNGYSPTIPVGSMRPVPFKVKYNKRLKSFNYPKK